MTRAQISIQWFGAAATTLAALTLAWAIPICTTSASAAPTATAARTLNVTDTAHLHLVRTSGSLLIEQGSALGALPGTVKSRFRVGPTISASFTIYPRGGSISVHAWGTLHSSGVYASFGGSMSVSGGSGLYAHARGTGGFYGVVNRHTWALTAQTTGKLSY